jgi:hypothetical protein
VIRRRIRDGRQVQARKLRRATLQSERNSVLLRLGGMLATVDRFALLVQALRSAGEAAAGDGAGGSSDEGRRDPPDPETRDSVCQRRDAGGGSERRDGTPAPPGADHLIL